MSMVMKAPTATPTIKRDPFKAEKTQRGSLTVEALRVLVAQDEPIDLDELTALLNKSPGRRNTHRGVSLVVNRLIAFGLVREYAGGPKLVTTDVGVVLERHYSHREIAKIMAQTTREYNRHMGRSLRATKIGAAVEWPVMVPRDWERRQRDAGEVPISAAPPQRPQSSRFDPEERKLQIIDNLRPTVVAGVRLYGSQHKFAWAVGTSQGYLSRVVCRNPKMIGLPALELLSTKLRLFEDSRLPPVRELGTFLPEEEAPGEPEEEEPGEAEPEEEEPEEDVPPDDDTFVYMIWRRDLENGGPVMEQRWTPAEARAAVERVAREEGSTGRFWLFRLEATLDIELSTRWENE